MKGYEVEIYSLGSKRVYILRQTEKVTGKWAVEWMDGTSK